MKERGLSLFRTATFLERGKVLKFEDIVLKEDKCRRLPIKDTRTQTLNCKDINYSLKISHLYKTLTFKFGHFLLFSSYFSFYSLSTLVYRLFRFTVFSKTSNFNVFFKEILEKTEKRNKRYANVGRKKQRRTWISRSPDPNLNYPRIIFKTRIGRDMGCRLKS